MKTDIRNRFGLGLVCIVALAAGPLGCSSSSSGGGGGGGNPDSGKSDAPSGSDAAASGNCGTASCDPTTQYCQLSASTDAQGNVTWSTSGCKAIPSGCTLPADPSTCTTDPTPCDPSTFCTCVQKAASCPTTGVVVTKCAESGSLIGSGCTSG